MKNNKISPFDEYKKLDDPSKTEKSEIWETAIGLQDVDGLKTSEYLYENAKAHIVGDITIDEVKARLESYYKAQGKRAKNEKRTEEADKVSARIAC